MAFKYAWRSSGRNNRNIRREEQPRINRRRWEVRFGCFAAFALTVLEVKRLLLITLEMLLDSRTIRFAGSLMPLIFSFVDVGLGFPVATVAVYAIRKHQVQPCYPKIKRIMRRATVILAVCVVLNVVTIVLIVCRVSFRTDFLSQLFRRSMKLYAKKASDKVTIDQLQLDLQCCGVSSYIDWFDFDWQGVNDCVDCADREAEEGDQEDQGGSVPFSCCSQRTMLPCVHSDMRKEDERTVNGHGCAAIISGILYKIAVVGYTMTSLIIFTQIVIIIFLIRIIRRVFPEICPETCRCCDDRYPLSANVITYSSDECSSQSSGKRVRIKTTKKRKTWRCPIRRNKKSRGTDSSRSSSPTKGYSTTTCTSTCSIDGDSSNLSERLTSSPGSSAPKITESARIPLSAQQQHKLPAQQTKQRR